MAPRITSRLYGPAARLPKFDCASICVEIDAVKTRTRIARMLRITRIASRSLNSFARMAGCSGLNCNYDGAVGLARQARKGGARQIGLDAARQPIVALFAKLSQPALPTTVEPRRVVSRQAYALPSRLTLHGIPAPPRVFLRARFDARSIGSWRLAPVEKPLPVAHALPTNRQRTEWTGFW